jgi:hypothetical protein
MSAQVNAFLKSSVGVAICLTSLVALGIAQDFRNSSRSFSGSRMSGSGMSGSGMRSRSSSFNQRNSGTSGQKFTGSFHRFSDNNNSFQKFSDKGINRNISSGKRRIAVPTDGTNSTAVGRRFVDKVISGNKSNSKLPIGSSAGRIVDSKRLNPDKGPFNTTVFKGIKQGISNPVGESSKPFKFAPQGTKLPGFVSNLGIKAPGLHPKPTIDGPGGWKFPPINGHHHDHHGHHHDHHGDHHNHGHHHHHKPWIVISWTPGYYVPPVGPCPEPPVVVCPPPAPTCPPPVVIPVADPQLPAPPDDESLAADDSGAPSNAPEAEKTEADATELASAAKGDDAKQSTDIDLQVEYVQMVEAGNPESELGPLYRVWIVNNGGAAITTPFDVVLVATNEDTPSQESPYAADRVSQIGAGQRLSVEIRLPVEVLQLSVDAEGLPVPFKNLFAAADVRQELVELNEQNNALGLTRSTVPDASMVAAVE